MMKRFSQISFILGILVFVTGVQPIWADTTSISIKIGEGSGGGYSYSGIHTAIGRLAEVWLPILTILSFLSIIFMGS
jgi:hypothetical protein